MDPQVLYKWEKIKAEAPRARDSHTIVHINNQLIMFGGCGSGKTNTSFGDLHKFDLKTRQWTRLQNVIGDEMPQDREAHIAQEIDKNKMMIHGGLNQDELTFDDTFVLTGFDQDRGFYCWFKCQNLGDIPPARDSHSSCLIKDKIYIFGGQGVKDVFYNDIYSVRIIEQHKGALAQTSYQAIWQKIEFNMTPYISKGVTYKPTCPVQRTSQSMVAYKERYLVIIGGEAENQQSEEISFKDSNTL